MRTPGRLTFTSMVELRSSAINFWRRAGISRSLAAIINLPVVPTGDSVDNCDCGGHSQSSGSKSRVCALIGTTADASVGLFRLNDRPDRRGAGSVRVISGLPSRQCCAGIRRGDAISEPLSFGEASEYAAIDAGTYDLDILDAASGSSLLSVSQVPLAEGTITDIFLVGSLSDGSQQAAVVAIPGEIQRLPGRRAQIVAGNCESPDTELADLGLVRVGQGDKVGAPNTAEVAQGYAVAAGRSVQHVDPNSTCDSNIVRRTTRALFACGDIGGPTIGHGCTCH